MEGTGVTGTQTASPPWLAELCRNHPRPGPWGCWDAGLEVPAPRTNLQAGESQAAPALVGAAWV